MSQSLLGFPNTVFVTHQISFKQFLFKWDFFWTVYHAQTLQPSVQFLHISI